ncbi:hypothetical protein ONZ45_g5116 [Pleurotus djamor]|nr:hypothetical protein ONZ45_g5116 [Pleurotus djamor]
MAPYKSTYDVYAHYGRCLMTAYRISHLKGKDESVLASSAPTTESHVHASLPPSLVAADAEDPDLTVGILGAGVGGLYSALILESLDIKYEIIEASKRVGGRLYTHHFSEEKYDYYDVGAMRFPDTVVMTRLFHLFKYRPLNTKPFDLHGKLRDYHFKDVKGNSLMYFNDVRRTRGSKPSGDAFQWSQLDVGENYLDVGVDMIVKDMVEPFSNALVRDLQNGTQDGWDLLMQFDNYSTRAFMSTKYIPSPSLGLPAQPLSNTTVNWCETFDKSTGWYDRSLAETVLEDMCFSLPGEWKLIDGGSSQLAEVMASYLNTKDKGTIAFDSRVTGIGYDKDSKKMNISINGQPDKSYPHVISTLPLPCLRSLDLSKANLSHKQANALRQLTYGPSIKIGIKFKSHWWSTAKDKDGNPLDIVGGQSYTDRPVRTIVYPSYGLEEQTLSNVLIASYCWTNDAERFSALMNTGKKTYDDQLKDMVLRDLAVVHNLDIQFLRDEFVDIYPWSWGNDPLTMGAFAFFGPGMFSTAYTALTVPACDGRLHFAGEALSVRHAWVVGALDSAWRAAKELIVLVYGMDSDKYRKFTELWGYNEEWTKRSPTKVVEPELEGWAGGASMAKVPLVDLSEDLLLGHLQFEAPELFAA